MEPNILSSCLLSFLAVFILLGILAILIRLVTAIFPDDGLAADGVTSAVAATPGGVVQMDDTAIIAAIHTVASSAFSGARVTRIEELRK